jgi:alpha-galactosidase
MQSEFDEKTGRLSFRHADLPGVTIETSQAWAIYRLESGMVRMALFSGTGCSVQEESIRDTHGSANQRVIRQPADLYGIELTYRIKTYPQRPFLLFQLSLSNQSQAPISLRDFCLFQADPSLGGRLEINPASNGLHLLKIGWLGWSYSGLRTPRDRNSTSWLDHLTSQSYLNPVTPRPIRRGEFWSEGWTVLAGEDAALVVGLVSTAQQFGQVYACTRPGETALMLTTQLDGVRLDPGETRDSEWGYLQAVPLPNPEPLADFVEAIGRQMQARVPDAPPPAMWTHWYQFYHDISEQRFLESLDVLTGMRETVPYQVAELDDGYQSAWGDWLATNNRFPHGLEWLAGQIRQRGFTPGLWLAPFAVEHKSQLVREHPEWLVKNERGKPANAGFLYSMFIQALDLTHPEVLEHLRVLVDMLTHQWGFGMLKVDFLNAAALPGRRFDPKRTRAEALRAGLESIRQGAGDGTFLLGCGCPFGPAIGVVDAMRIGPDTAPSWEPYFHWLAWAGPLIRKNPSMPSLRNALRNTLNLNSLHERVWWNDPDCLLVRNEGSRLSEAEVQSAVSLIGLSGGMLISSDDPGKISAERLRWVSLLLPNLGLRGLPMDGLEREMPVRYRVKLDKDGQVWQLVALFNWEDQPEDIHLRLVELGYSPQMELHMFDFWSGEYQRVSAPELVFTSVPAHGCKLLRVCQVGEGIQIVGDTLHISQGLEINKLILDGERLVVETMDMGRQVEGDLWLLLGLEPKEASCNGEWVSIEQKGEEVYALKVGFMGKGRIDIMV